MKKKMLALICTVLLLGSLGTALAQPPRYDDWRGGIRSRIEAAEEL